MKASTIILFLITLTISLYGQPEILLNNKSATCNGDASGFLDVSVVGGTAPYSYLWNTGDITEDIAGLFTGVYTLSVLDANNDSVLASFFVPDVGVSVSLGSDTTVCPGETIVVSANVTLQLIKDSLHIVYDASQGVTGLVGASKVYMHSGAELVPFGGWQLVTGNWGLDDSVGLMKNIGPDLWEMVIHPESYYGMNPGATLNGIFMVFRNADGTATGKDASDQDIFLYTAPSPPTSTFSGISGTWLLDSSVVYLWSDGSTAPNITVSLPGTYMLTVLNSNGCLGSDSIMISSAANCCVAATALYADQLQPRKARLNWTPEAGANHYRIRGRNLSNPNWVEILIPGAAISTKKIAGLSNNNSFIWQIRSFCDIAETDSSDWSGLDTFVTGCYAPDSLWSDPVGQGSARFNWNKVSGASGYEVRGQVIGSSGWVNVLVGGGNTEFKDVFGLSSSTAYRWKVRTICDPAGAVKSAYTDVDTFVTLSSRMSAMNDPFDVETGSAFRLFYASKGDIYIQSTKDAEQIEEISLIDMSGKEIQNQGRQEENKATILKSGLSNGLYQVIIRTRSGLWTEKVLMID